MKSPGFFSELKRRNVYKVAVAYAVIAWLLIQAGSILFPTFEAPSWVMKVFVMIIAVGFLIALLIAWTFEMTPEGMKRTENVSPNEKLPQWSKRKFGMLIVSVATLAAGLLVFQLWRGWASQKSIAVLPFENRSRDPENAYFAEGVQDEILTRLAKVADLKVISRTSTQRFKSSGENLPQIAKQLGVAHILEGSVQKQEGQVRVNVQLIKATTDEHVWAESFDRKLTDIFAVESEIARNIADKLRAKLSGSEVQAIAARPTENGEAYQLCLKGRFFWNKRTRPDLQKAIEYFNQAIAKDPGYSVAHVGLAEALILLPAFGAGAPDEFCPRAEAAAKKALELDDTLGEAHASLAQLLFIYRFDFPRSITEFERAIRLNPNYATAHQWFGDTLSSIAQFDRAITELKRALELDPLSLIINADLGSMYFTARRYDEAIDQFRRTMEMDPDFFYAHWALGQALEIKGDFAAAIAECEKASQLSDDPLTLAMLGHVYAVSGKRDEAIKILDQLTELAKHQYVAAYDFALLNLGLGQKTEALRWLEKSYQDHAGSDIGFIKVDPMLDPLRGHPRFEALVQKIFAAKDVKSEIPSPSS